ncbi:MAG: IPT/TIG domain-containing protein [Deltaproteobacteria bacterium]|nr:IPT/TIG domain-containing protein [Deltaproteobacteria bacterium]
MCVARLGMALWAALVVTATGLATPGYAEKVIWHYDSLPSVMDELANGLEQHPVFAHPGFVKGEAYGAIFKPKATDYPVKILTVELVMAQAKGQKDQKTDIAIEIYNDDGNGPAPKGPPVFSITSKDFANGGNIGQPVVGNTGMIYQFDWSKPENHPPLIDKGNIYLVIRYLNDSASLENMWGKLECSKTNLGIGIDFCGCQNVAAISDQSTTIGVNLFHVVWPIGTCSGGKQWKFAEQVYAGNPNIKGDFVLRMGVDGVALADPDAGSTGGDTSSADAGSTTPDAGGTVKDTVVPVQPPEITGITPAFGPVDKPTSVDIYGKNFQKGLIAKLGTEAIKVQDETVTPTGFSAVVVGVAVGTYDLVVKNPDGQVAFKTAAYTVKAAAAPDAAVDVQETAAAPEVTAVPEVTAAPEVTPEAASAGPFALEIVKPSCVEYRQDTLLTVLGTGFVKGMELKVGTTPLLAVDVVHAGRADGLLPKDVAPGNYSLFGTLPSGEQKALANAVRVAVSCAPAVVGAPADSGCSAGSRGNAWAAGLLGFALLGLAAWRARPVLARALSRSRA